MDSMFSGQAKSGGFHMRAPEVDESDDESTSSNSTPSFGLNSSQSFGSTNAPLFGSGSAPSFGVGSSPSFSTGSMPSFGISTSSAPSSVGSTSGSFVFGQPVASVSTASTPVFGSSFGTSASSSAFSFGGATSASAPSSSAFSIVICLSFGGATSASAPSFGAPVNSSAGSSFTFGGSNPTPSFNFASNPTHTFGSTPSPSPMEDNMAEDTHVSTSAIPAPNFGISTQTGTAPSSFLFGDQQSTTPNPFAGNAPSTSMQGGCGLEFFQGFSLDARAGCDKAGSKFIKSKRDKARRK